ncbi:MAG TPA: hypothetical protein VMC85_16380, partial [Desulfomonilaceae bacterium]|nr:hypothetical protein [Desulfomonilaceae bacterium]
LMRWFGEQKLLADKRIAFAVSWWRSTIGAFPAWRYILTACMMYPTDCYISPSASSVLRAKILEHEREQKAAHLLSAFTWVAYKEHEKDFQEVWLAIRDCVSGLFTQDEAIQNLILLELIPKWLHLCATRDESVDENQRTSYLVRISSSLPHSDKERFEATLAKVLRKSHK